MSAHNTHYGAADDRLLGDLKRVSFFIAQNLRFNERSFLGYIFVHLERDP